MASRAVTQHLRELAQEASALSKDGEVLTRAQALALLLWNRALGWEEPDPDDPKKMVRKPPEKWAAEFVVDRLEGKAPTEIRDEEGTFTVEDKVDEQARNRVNAMTLSQFPDDEGPEDE